MMLTIHGLPISTKYHDLKLLVKQQCNLNDFILDNLMGEGNGTKSVRIGVADNREGDHLIKCLDGYRLQGHPLRVMPMGKTPSTTAPQQNFNQRSGGLPTRDNYSAPGADYSRVDGPRPDPWGPGSNQWGSSQPVPGQPMPNNYNYQQPAPGMPQPYVQQQAAHGQRSFDQRDSYASRAPAPDQRFGYPPKTSATDPAAQRRPDGRSHVLRSVEIIDEPLSRAAPQPPRYPAHGYDPPQKPITIMKDNFQGPQYNMERSSQPGQLSVHHGQGHAQQIHGQQPPWTQAIPPEKSQPFGKSSLSYDKSYDRKYVDSDKRQMLSKEPLRHDGYKGYEKDNRYSPNHGVKDGPRFSPRRDVSKDGPRFSPRRDMKETSRFSPRRDIPKEGPRFSPRRDMLKEGPRFSPRRDMPKEGPRFSPRRDILKEGPRFSPRRDIPKGPRFSPRRDIPKEGPRFSPRRDMQKEGPRFSPRRDIPKGGPRFSPRRDMPKGGSRFSPKRDMQKDGPRFSPRREIPKDGPRFLPRMEISKEISRFSPREVSKDGHVPRFSPRRDVPKVGPGPRFSPSRAGPVGAHGRRESPPGRRGSPSDRRMPRRSPARLESPPGHKRSSPGRYSPTRRHDKPIDKYGPDTRSTKDVRPAYEPPPQAPSQAMYSGGYRPNIHENIQYPIRGLQQMEQRTSPWQDSDKTMFTSAMKKDEDRRDAGRAKFEPRPEHQRAPPNLEKKSHSPVRKSRSPVRRERSPLRDHYKKHSPSPRSPRRSWALEKRRSPDLRDAPPPPIWPGQNRDDREDQYRNRRFQDRDDDSKGKAMPVWERPSFEEKGYPRRPEIEEQRLPDNRSIRVRSDLGPRQPNVQPPRREPSPRGHGFKPVEPDRFSQREPREDFPEHRPDFRRADERKPYERPDFRDSQRPDDRDDDRHLNKREEFARREERKEIFGRQAFDKELDDVYKRAVEFNKKAQEMRRSGERRRSEYSEERRSHERDRHDPKEFDRSKFQREEELRRREIRDDHLERPADERRRHEDFDKRDREPEWKPNEERLATVSPSIRAKREKAIDEISKEITDKYTSTFNLDLKKRVFEEMKITIARIMREMFGNQDVSFIEMVVKFNAKYDLNEKARIFNEVMSVFPSQYRIMKRPAQESAGPTEVPAKTARRSPEHIMNQDMPRVVTNDNYKFRQHPAHMKRLPGRFEPERRFSRLGQKFNKSDYKIVRNVTQKRKVETPAVKAVKPVEKVSPPKKDIPQTPSVEPTPDGHYELNPLMTRMLETELQKIMIKVWQELPDEPPSEAEKLVVDKFRTKVSDDLRNVLGLNVTKRLLNIHNPLFVKICFSRKPDKVMLKSFMKTYDLTALKKVGAGDYLFAAQLRSLSAFDKLCEAKVVRCGFARVTITPCYKFIQCPSKLKTIYNEKQSDVDNADADNKLQNESLNKSVEMGNEAETVKSKKNLESSEKSEVKCVSKATNTPQMEEKIKAEVQSSDVKPRLTELKNQDKTTPTSVQQKVETKLTSDKSKVEAKVNTSSDKSKIEVKVNQSSDKSKVEAKPNPASEKPTVETKVHPTVEKPVETISQQINKDNTTSEKPKVNSTPGKSTLKPNDIKTPLKSNEETKATSNTGTTQINTVSKKPVAKTSQPLEKQNADAKTNIAVDKPKNEAKVNPVPEKTKINAAPVKAVTKTPDKPKLAPKVNAVPEKPKVSQDKSKTITTGKVSATGITKTLSKINTEVKSVNIKKKPEVKLPLIGKVNQNTMITEDGQELHDDDDELDDEDILALMSEAIILDECDGSDED